MKCADIMAMLPDYAAGALDQSDADEVRAHLEQPCAGCQRELDELADAAALLAEDLLPIEPPPHVKQQLLERIEQGAAAPASISAASESAAPRWVSYLPYVAALLLAMVVGAVVGRYVTNGDASPGLDEWRRRIAAAEQAFDAQASPARHLRLGREEDFSATVYPDPVAGQLHVLVTNAEPPSEGHRLWIWFGAENQQQVGGPLDYFGDGRAAAVIDLELPPESIRRVLLTEELPGDHDTPTGPVLGTAQLEE